MNPTDHVIGGLVASAYAAQWGVGFPSSAFPTSVDAGPPLNSPAVGGVRYHVAQYVGGAVVYSAAPNAPCLIGALFVHSRSPQDLAPVRAGAPFGYPPAGLLGAPGGVLLTRKARCGAAWGRSLTVKSRRPPASLTPQFADNSRADCADGHKVRLPLNKRAVGNGSLLAGVLQIIVELSAEKEARLKKDTERKRVRRKREGISHREWLELRREVLERDGRACVYCGGGEEPLHVDHKVPVALGGKSEIGNLVTSCQRCNLAKGSMSYEGWKQLCQ